MNTFVRSNVDSTAVADFGRNLLSTYQKSLLSFESASQAICAAIFENFVEDDGTPTFCMARVFKSMSYDELLPELQELVEDQDKHYFALMATTGDIPMFQHRRNSITRRQVIAIDENMTPLFMSIMNHFNLYSGQIPNPNMPSAVEVKQTSSYMYFISDLPTSPYHKREGFAKLIREQNLHSSLALASPFLSGEAHMMLMYSHYQLDDHFVESFANLAPYTSTVLAHYDAGTTWDAE